MSLSDVKILPLFYFAKNEYHYSFYEIIYAPIEVIWVFLFNVLIVLNHPLMGEKSLK